MSVPSGPGGPSFMRALLVPVGVSIIVVGLVMVWKGAAFGGSVIVLGILEISLSFDNAFVNAIWLKRLSPFWQTMFLWIGLPIAVFGMRLLMPILLVHITSGMSMSEVWNLAFNNPDEYSVQLEASHPAILAFGGIFLLLIFLNFLLDNEKESYWLGAVERTGDKFADVDGLSLIIAGVVIWFGSIFLVSTPVAQHQVRDFGFAALIIYALVSVVSDRLEPKEEEDAELAAETAGIAPPPIATKMILRTGMSAFVAILFLEVIDASFSFDGVSAAFAITSNPVLIAIGLGIGAIYIRSLTIYYTRSGALEAFVYLNHGAMYAIGAIATLQLVSLKFDIPSLVTSLSAVGILGTAAFCSMPAYRRKKAEEAATIAETAALVEATDQVVLTDDNTTADDTVLKAEIPTLS